MRLGALQWPGYMRYSFRLSITSRRWHFREAYADHVTRSYLAATIAEEVDRYSRIAQVGQSSFYPTLNSFPLMHYLVGV